MKQGCSSSRLLTKTHGVVYALTLAMLGILIYELVYNAREQGNPFSFKVCALLNVLLSGSGFLNVDQPPCVADSKSNAWAFIDCPDYSGRSVPPLYEAGIGYPTEHQSPMCVSSKGPSPSSCE